MMANLFVIIKNKVPYSLRLNILRLNQGFQACLTYIFSKNIFLVNIYYLLFNRKFDQEHLRVLRGRRFYYKQLSKTSNSSPLLRRNIHRLEKGLIMKPRRKFFAESFIQDTVECYILAQNSHTSFSTEELKWSKHVLKKYFLENHHTPTIQKAYVRFMQNNNIQHLDESKLSSVPYKYKNSVVNPVNFDQFQALVHRRSSVRWFKDIPVEDSIIDDIVNLCVNAPSACNRQPYRFLVFNDPVQSSEIAKCAGGTQGFSHQIPVTIVVIGDLSAYSNERDKHVIYIDSSLASMQLMLAAEAKGLGTCAINWPDLKASDNKIKRFIHLESYEAIVMLIALGYPDPEGKIPFSHKKQGNEIFSIGNFKND